MLHTSGRILLVEDDPHDVELMGLALEPLGLTSYMDVALDGEQALQYLGVQPPPSSPIPLPQLILLDLKLPKVSGLRVLQAIRQHPLTSQLVVVVLTSSQEDSDIQSCYQIGINSYIVKPLDYKQFLEVAQSVSHYWLALNQSPLSTAA